MKYDTEASVRGESLPVVRLPAGLPLAAKWRAVATPL
jgi:hypothetical protein